ncbi:MAG: hypothetical protein OXI08_10875 [Cyanobacteria bacterium MAG IRC4_bin_6]|nr:hypothetical protein [Cyanobacteria bacterium MAG IRC3_bin_20]MDE0648514.1 hypothetical protein [Cyanobacteria bacterium MAG IRC4_bin_6]
MCGGRAGPGGLTGGGAGSLLPADADRQTFLHILGIHGDPVAAKKCIAKATREGVRLGADAYGYSRAFSYSPREK